jgi:hypothetical protein
MICGLLGGINIAGSPTIGLRPMDACRRAHGNSPSNGIRAFSPFCTLALVARQLFDPMVNAQTKRFRSRMESLLRILSSRPHIRVRKFFVDFIPAHSPDSS